MQTIAAMSELLKTNNEFVDDSITPWYTALNTVAMTTTNKHPTGKHTLTLRQVLNTYYDFPCWWQAVCGLRGVRIALFDCLAVTALCLHLGVQ